MAWLGLDLGTGSVKAAIVDDDGRVLAKASRPYEVLTPQPGWAESDPAAWLAAVREAAADVLEGREVDGAGFSGQMHGVVLTDAEGMPLRPAILWADGRAVAQAAAMRRELGPKQLARLGSPAVPGFAATTLRWLADSDLLADAAHVLQPKDWLRQALGGAIATDPSDASGTLLAEVASGTWSESAVAWSGVRPDQLPAIESSIAPSGAIELAGREIPVRIGGADTACALAGLALQPGDAFMAVGSGAQVVSVLAEPAIDPTLATHTFAAVGDAGSAWYRLAAVQNAGIALGAALGWLGASIDEAHAALDTPMRADDPLFLAALSGERFLRTDLRGAWDGLTLSTDRQALLRSILEGMAQLVAIAADALRSAGAELPSVVPLVGGGSQDRRFQQLLADATGLALGPVEAPDAAVIGAAMLGAGRLQAPHGPRIGATVEPSAAAWALLAERRARLLTE